MSVENRTETHWYVLRDLKRPNSKSPAYKVLQEIPSVKVFVPLKQQIFQEFGKRVIRWIPFMPDLLFVYGNQEQLQPIMQRIDRLQFRYVRGKQHEPMTIADLAMDNFIRAVELSDRVEYYTLDEVSAHLYGKQIRIIGGCLNGLTGRLMTKRGSRVKRLIIELEACNLAAAVQIEPEYIQLLNDEHKRMEA